MSLHIQGGSARIYQFPKRGQFARVGGTGLKTMSVKPVAAVICTESWYHDAAIEEDRESRNAQSRLRDH